MTTGITAEHLVDTCGLKCPMPIIELQKKVRNLSSEETVKILFTDPKATEDIRSWCRVNKHQLLSDEPSSEASHDQTLTTWAFYIKVK